MRRMNFSRSNIQLSQKVTEVVISFLDKFIIHVRPRHQTSYPNIFFLSSRHTAKAHNLAAVCCGLSGTIHDLVGCCDISLLPSIRRHKLNFEQKIRSSPSRCLALSPGLHLRVTFFSMSRLLSMSRESLTRLLSPTITIDGLKHIRHELNELNWPFQRSSDVTTTKNQGETKNSAKIKKKEKKTGKKENKKRKREKTKEKTKKLIVLETLIHYADEKTTTFDYDNCFELQLFSLDSF